MFQEVFEYSIRSKIRSQVLLEIFSDISQNMVESVYFIAHCIEDGLKLEFRTQSQEILITIIINKEVFQHYTYNPDCQSWHKYYLEEFSFLNTLIENRKCILGWDITPDRMIVTYTQNGFSKFVSRSVQIDMPESEEHGNLSTDKLVLRIQKAGIFDTIIMNANLSKLNELRFRYNSVSKKLIVGDAASGIEWQIKVTEETNALNKQLIFSIKMIRCAWSLLSSEEEIILTLLADHMIIKVPKKERSFSIRINGRVEIDEF